MGEVVADDAYIGNWLVECFAADGVCMGEFVFSDLYMCMCCVMCFEVVKVVVDVMI